MAANQESRLADNVLSFCRTLRAAGLSIGTGQMIDALHAVQAVGISRREDWHQALAAVLVSEPGEFRLFQQAFHVYFRNPRLLERMIAMLLPDALAGEGAAGEAVLQRLVEALGLRTQEAPAEVTVDADRSATWSYREILRTKDFEHMTLEEQRDAKVLLREQVTYFERVPTRRFQPSATGERYDLRRSMQSMTRNNGQLIKLARKRRASRPPVLVLICDISGSMSRYSRMFLQFAHALCASGNTVHSFVFGTRLTNISRRLRGRDVDSALAQIAADVRDWDGGTRIAESLGRFNRDWSRRVLAQNAVVVLLSDGLERDSESDLEFEMRSLGRSCRQLLWLNPMLRYSGFEPRASGIARMLPYVDRFMPAHNIASLSSLGEILRKGSEDDGLDSRARRVFAA